MKLGAIRIVNVLCLLLCCQQWRLDLREVRFRSFKNFGLHPLRTVGSIQFSSMARAHQSDQRWPSHRSLALPLLVSHPHILAKHMDHSSSFRWTNRAQEGNSSNRHLSQPSAQIQTSNSPTQDSRCANPSTLSPSACTELLHSRMKYLAT